MEVNYGRGNTPTARTGRQDTNGATTGASPGTLGAFTYKGAMGLNPDDHAEVSGICAGSGQPPLLAFDEDDEVFVNSHWMAFSNKGWPVKRGDRVDVVIGNFRAERLVVE